MVSIVTFITYIALGNSLDVATALTSLALFELLRFPVFMFPNVSTLCMSDVLRLTIPSGAQLCGGGARLG